MNTRTHAWGWACAGVAVAILASLVTPRGVSAQLSVDELELVTSDGITLYAYQHLVDDAGDRPLVLLFHQGASNARAEYGPLLPQVVDAGFDVVMVDQRRGGSRFGGINRTVEALGDREFSYCDTYADVEAVLAHARTLTDAPVVVWGSSYSATMVLKLAAERPGEIDRVLSFSPASGEPMAGCDPGDFAADVEVPVLVLRPRNEAEIPRLAEQLAWFDELGFRTHVADPGVHGSSMLNPARVESDVSHTWTVVLDFLEDAKATRR